MDATATFNKQETVTDELLRRCCKESESRNPIPIVDGRLEPTTAFVRDLYETLIANGVKISSPMNAYQLWVATIRYPPVHTSDGDTPSKLHEFELLFSCSNGSAPSLRVLAETMVFGDGMVVFESGGSVIGTFPIASLVYAIQTSSLKL